MNAGARAPGGAGNRWPQAVLFDLDGTLADSFPAIEQALAVALASEGLPPRPLAWVRRHVGRGAAALVQAAVGGVMDEERLEQLRQRYLAAYAAIGAGAAPPMEGARDALEFAAAGTGGRVAVVSNKLASASRIWLAHWDLERFIAVVSGPDVCGALKPDAAAVDGVLDALGVAASEALLVGDMDVDAATGTAVGMPVVLVGASVPAPPQPGSVLATLESVAHLPSWLVHNGVGWR